MRRVEAQEVTERIEGPFYRGEFAAEYDRGFRFVGRLDQDGCRSVLDDAQRDRVDAVFGPTLSRLRMRAEFRLGGQFRRHTHSISQEALCGCCESLGAWVEMVVPSSAE